MIRSLACLVLLCGVVFSQSIETKPSFDMADVHVTDTTVPQRFGRAYTGKLTGRASSGKNFSEVTAAAAKSPNWTPVAVVRRLLSPARTKADFTSPNCFTRF